MTVTKVYVTRTIRCKDGGSWSFQVEAEMPTIDYEIAQKMDTSNGKISKCELPKEHNFLKDIAELQDKLHHFTTEGKFAEHLEHSKTES